MTRRGGSLLYSAVSSYGSRVAQATTTTSSTALTTTLATATTLTTSANQRRGGNHQFHLILVQQHCWPNNLLCRVLANRLSTNRQARFSSFHHTHSYRVPCPSRRHLVVTATTRSIIESATTSKRINSNNNNGNMLIQNQPSCVNIIHFNDCYNVEPNAHSSGAAGFLTAVNQHRHLNPMILFSGDIISPSFMSTFTKGEQMIPVLNDIKVDCAVFGNHEFDYGVDNLIAFVKRTTFPWLLSNVIDKETSNQLGDGLVYHIIEKCGIKFGLIGLIEEEWLSTLSTLDSSDVIYEDFVTKGKELATWLKSDPHNVDYVIALTHFRTPNDIRLADSVPEIDLILGGHDHDYEIIKRHNCYIIKSGTDFREFSNITLKINLQYLQAKKDHQQEVLDCQKPILDVHIERVDCKGYEPDPELKSKLEKFVSTIDEKMGKVLGQFNCELDGRFSSIRKYETNLGNFVTDIMLASTHADLAILNSGTLRSDRIHPRGDFTMRDLFNILGYIDPIAVLSATGYQVWRALENGVSHWPKLEGRFPQVSGCSFAFDPSKPSGQRIDPKDIFIGDEPLVLDKKYRLSTKAYLAGGKDGYDMLKECEVLVPGDETPDLTTSILNHFEAINIVKSNRRTHHRQSIICLSRQSLQKILNSVTLPDGSSPNVHYSPSSPYCQTPMSINDSCETNHNHLHNHSHNNNYPTTPQNPFYPHTPLGVVRENSGGSCEGDQQQLEQTNNNSSNNNNVNDANNNDNKTQSESSVGSATLPALNDGFISTTNGSHNHHEEQQHQPQQNTTMDELKCSSPLDGRLAPTPSTRNLLSSSGPSLAGSATTMATPLSSIHPPKARGKRLMSLYDIEHEQCKLEPKVEGRIRIVGMDTAAATN